MGTRIKLELYVPNQTVKDLRDTVTEFRREFFDNPELMDTTAADVVRYLQNIDLDLDYEVVSESMADGTRCGHKEYAEGYCAEMICSNYAGKRMAQRQEDDENDDMSRMIEEQRG